MDSLIVLADIAAMQQPISSLKEKRLGFLQKARARMAEIRTQRKAGTYVSNPKPKKVIDPNWRHANIKKAHIALAKKHAYKKMMNEDTEEE